MRLWPTYYQDKQRFFFMDELTFNTRADFRRWLQQNHDKETALWVVYFKKKTGIPSITYEEAVMEALCFGWIDSKVQTIDELRYRQIFTPRKPRSVWSDLNKKRVKLLKEAGLMHAAGLQVIDEAKKSGMWQKSYGAQKKQKIPDELKAALMANPQALENFNNFAPSYRLIYIAWVSAAKREETKKSRIEKVVLNCLKNIKPGMV